MTRSSRTIAALRAGAVVLTVTLLILWMSGFFTDKIAPGSDGAAPLTVRQGAEWITVEEERLPIIEEATGTVQAERKTTVSARILATIVDIPVRAGDSVRRGDVVVRLDAADLASRTAEAQRAIEAATATQQRTQGDLQRARKLVAKGVMSRAEFDQIEAAARVADAELARAAEVQQRARINLDYATITSPVDGRVVDRLAEPGDTAAPGVPLMTLYDPTALRVEVAVRESLVSQLKVGQTVRIRLGAETVDAGVDEIVPQAETGSRTFLVKLGLAHHDELFTGTFARVLLPAGQRMRWLVPASAVQRVGQLDFVYVADAAGANRRLVTLGATTEDGRIEVLSGVRAGERVLRSPDDDLELAVHGSGE